MKENMVFGLTIDSGRLCSKAKDFWYNFGLVELQRGKGEKSI